MLLRLPLRVVDEAHGESPGVDAIAEVAAHDDDVVDTRGGQGAGAASAGWAGRPPCTMHLGISSVFSPRRRPRPAATMMALSLIASCRPSFSATPSSERAA